MKQYYLVTQSNSHIVQSYRIFMTNKFYKCDYCNRDFSRKWNALRHNKIKHSNAAKISDDNINTNGLSYKSRNKYYEYQNKFKLLKQVEREIDKNEFDFYFSDLFTANPTDIKIIKIIDQLIKPFDELKDLLIDIEDKTKAFVLVNSLYSSLQTNNPVHSMNETVELYRSMRGVKKIAKYMSILEGEISDDPLLILREKIQTSPIFGRQNN